MIMISSGSVPLVDHEGLGSKSELDGGGRYLHHLVDGAAIRVHFPELVMLYHGIRFWIQDLTLLDVVLSPYPDSDINIKAYPPGGGTVGPHFDTNGITVLVYLTSNTEGPLRLWPAVHDPWRATSYEQVPASECIEILPSAGSMLLMQGRKIWHDSKPLDSEFKAVAIFNYYWTGDVRRPGHFDDFVYRGQAPL